MRMSEEGTAEDLQSWVSGLDGLFARVAGRFGRVEPRRRARTYLRGLLAPVERKNGWQPAEAAGGAAPDRMQRLLNNARWDAREMRADLRAYVMENLGHGEGVLIVDETGFAKRGTRSAGVQRQYSGTAGRVGNCQLGVFLAYASPLGRALIDAELYLPKSWLADRPRCEQAGIPASAECATKPMLARAKLARALDADVPTSWATADEAYGRDYAFRSFLEQRRLGYVVAVPKSQMVGAGFAMTPAPISWRPRRSARRPAPSRTAGALWRCRRTAGASTLAGGRDRTRLRAVAAGPPQPGPRRQGRMARARHVSGFDRRYVYV
jgi:SRSO17 transposase